MNKKQRIQEMLNRAVLLQPDACERVSAYFTRMLDLVDKPDSAEKLKGLTERAKNDKEALRQLNALRMININNFLLPASNAAAFFDVVTLAEDESPYITNETRQQIHVRYVGEDGGIRMTQAVKQKATQAVDLRWKSSDVYEYPLVDIHKGRVADVAKAQFDIAFDLAISIDQDLWPLIKALVGNFTLSGKKELRTYVAHPAVNPANLPTGNLITVTGNTSSSKFRLQAIKEVLAYCSRWGNNTFQDGDLAPVTFYIPSLHVSDFLDEVDADSQDNEITRQIFASGYVLSLAGRTFNIVGDSTLNPAEKMAYVRTNKPIGMVFEKPSLEEIIEDTGEGNVRDRLHNKGYMAMKKPFGAATPTQMAPNVIGVKYGTTA